MTTRLLAVLTLLLAQSGCSPETDSDAGRAPADFSGLYDVVGSSEEVGSGESRRLSGTVVLRQEGDRYTATFELDTQFPYGDTRVAATVIGHGAGSVNGRELIGEAVTQVVISTVPGVDPGFAFVPRMVTTRVVSVSKTVIEDDGSVRIELENRAADGASYRSTRTRLKGIRVALLGRVPPTTGERPSP